MKRPWPPIEDLLRDLDDPSRHVRCRAAQGLGEGRDPRAVEPLLRALRDRAGDVRAKAAVALGRLRDERAIGPLVEALRDGKVSVRSGAAAAVKKFGKRAYRPLIEAYPGSSGEFRSALIGALAHYKTDEVSELLIAALDDPDRRLHLEVLRLLGRRKDRRAVEPLLAALAAAKAEVDRAVRAWGEAAIDDDPRAAARLHAEMPEGAQVAVRLDGYVRALGEIGDARAFEPLQELLESQGAADFMGLMPPVITALRKIDNARAVDLLHGLMDDPTHPGRDRLEMTLAGMDLMNATWSLRASAKAGDLGVLWQALGAARETLAQLQSQTAGPQEATADEGEAGRVETGLLRRLEETLRDLARGRPGA